MIVAVDSETYFSDVCSVKNTSSWHYCRHPEWYCYIISIATDTGLVFSGPPETAPWDQISGEDAIWLSHNKSFDAEVIARLRETGKIPASAAPGQWHCTADLCAFLGMPRSLKNSVKELFGAEISKNIRDSMKGKHYRDLPAEKQNELVEYAKGDAEWCLKIWLEHGHKWPEHERWLSEHTRQIGNRGVPINVEALQSHRKTLRRQLLEAEEQIPWVVNNNPEEEGKALLSTKALAIECRKVGIEPPSSLAKDSEECAAWEDKYGEVYPWVAAMRQWRRGNTLHSKVESMLDRCTEDGRMLFSLLYGGGHTMRWSGSGGVNMQNLPAGELLGVDLRSCIKAPVGYKLLIADLSQIEPRCLAHLCGNTKLLAQLAGGTPIYEAFARVALGWTGGPLKKEDPQKYKLAKAMVLGLGYGCGATKFVKVAKTLADLDVSEEEAQVIVPRFRHQNPLIVGFWRKLDAFIARCAGKSAEFVLPSGRKLTYRDVKVGGGLSGAICRQGKMMRVKLWGGYVTENLTQAFARDVFADSFPRIEAAGIPILFHVHDEVICLAKEEEAEEKFQQLLKIMSTPPAWCPNLPLAAEGKITNIYEK